MLALHLAEELALRRRLQGEIALTSTSNPLPNDQSTPHENTQPHQQNPPILPPQPGPNTSTTPAPSSPADKRPRTRTKPPSELEQEEADALFAAQLAECESQSEGFDTFGTSDGDGHHEGIRGMGLDFGDVLALAGKGKRKRNAEAGPSKKRTKKGKTGGRDVPGLEGLIGTQQGQGVQILNLSSDNLDPQTAQMIQSLLSSTSNSSSYHPPPLPPSLLKSKTHPKPPRTSRPYRQPPLPLPLNPTNLTTSLSHLLAPQKQNAGQEYFWTPVGFLGEYPGGRYGGDGEGEKGKRVGPWGFEERWVKMFPALGRRNFCCIQEHQATAYHLDLRLQVDGGTFSWAVPRGFLNLNPGEHRLAVETTKHPISYSIHEGSDGRKVGNNTKCGTLLWEICEYSIDTPFDREGSPDRGEESEEEEEGKDELGKDEEAKLRQALYGRKVGGKGRAVKLILKNGKKFTNHAFTLLQTHSTFDSRGNPKKNWFIQLGKGITSPYTYDDAEVMKSVKTGRLLKEVTEAGMDIWVPREGERGVREDEGELRRLEEG